MRSGKGKPRKRKLDSGLRWGQGSVEVRGGKYIARWTDAAGKKRARTFTNQDDAEEFVRQEHRKRSLAQWTEPEQRTVADLVEAWLDRGAARWKPWTLATYRQRYTLHVQPELGETLALTVTTPRVQHWIDGLRRKGLSPAMIEAVTVVLTAAFNEAVGLGIVPRNPCHGVRKPSVRIQPRVVWTLEQVQAVIASLSDRPMWQALYALALTSGMRPGELRALTWPDIAPQTRQIRVRRTMTRDSTQHTMIGVSTKTGRVRTIAVPASVIQLLMRWKGEQPVVSFDGYVFSRADGDWLPVTNWERFHAKLIRELNLPHVTLHGMRHTAASLDMERGLAPKLLQEKLGHASITTTMDVYVQVSDRMQQDAADALGELLFGEDGILKHSGHR